MVPLGGILAYGAASPPNGFLMCDGQYYRRQDFPELFAVVQYAFGRDSANRFAVPNLQSRFPVGMGQGDGLSNRPLAERQGAESFQLRTAHLPGHTHGGNTSAGRAISYRLVDPKNGGGFGGAANHVTGFRGGAYADHSDANYPNSGHSHTISTDAGAGCNSEPVQHMPPYLAVNFIIRARTNLSLAKNGKSSQSPTKRAKAKAKRSESKAQD